MTISLLFLGATGYVGSPFLKWLIEQHKYEITVYIRAKDKEQGFMDLGCSVIIGTLDDLDLQEEAASKADIVINAASSDHLESTNALLKGMKKRFQQTGKPLIKLHVSGTGVLVDFKDMGNAPDYTKRLYNDSDVAKMASLPETAFHRAIDLAILKADSEGYIKSYIVLPSTIWGQAPDLQGLNNRRSQQFPAYVRACIQHRKIGTVGKFDNVWPQIHIDDQTEIFKTVFLAALDAQAPHGKCGYFFGENGHYEYQKWANLLGPILQRKGLVTDVTPQNFTESELTESYGEMWPYLGTNSLCKGKRARDLGWKPRFTLQDFYNGFDNEVDAVVSKM